MKLFRSAVSGLSSQYPTVYGLNTLYMQVDSAASGPYPITLLSLVAPETESMFKSSPLFAHYYLQVGM
jgi:hypothetical protein